MPSGVRHCCLRPGYYFLRRHVTHNGSVNIGTNPARISSEAQRYHSISDKANIVFLPLSFAFFDLVVCIILCFSCDCIREPKSRTFSEHYSFRLPLSCTPFLFTETDRNAKSYFMHGACKLRCVDTLETFSMHFEVVPFGRKQMIRL